MMNNMKRSSDLRFKEVRLKKFIEVLLKYIPEDKAKSILNEIGLLNDATLQILEKLKNKTPKPTPMSHKDPTIQREYERLYLTISSLREFVNSLDRRVSALERAMERVLEQLSALEEKLQ